MDLKQYAMNLSPLLLVASFVPTENTVDVGAVSFQGAESVSKALVAFKAAFVAPTAVPKPSNYLLNLKFLQKLVQVLKKVRDQP